MSYHKTKSGDRGRHADDRARAPYSGLGQVKMMTAMTLAKPVARTIIQPALTTIQAAPLAPTRGSVPPPTGGLARITAKFPGAVPAVIRTTAAVAPAPTAPAAPLPEEDVPPSWFPPPEEVPPGADFVPPPTTAEGPPVDLVPPPGGPLEVPAPPDEAPRGLSRGAKIGIGVAAGVGGLFLVYMLTRKKK